MWLLWSAVIAGAMGHLVPFLDGWRGWLVGDGFRSTASRFSPHFLEYWQGDSRLGRLLALSSVRGCASRGGAYVQVGYSVTVHCVDGCVDDDTYGMV